MIDETLSKIEPTSEVLKKVQAIIDEVDERISTKVDENFTNLDERIKRIYYEELWCKGKFGPEEEMYKTMKDLESRVG